MQLAQYPDYKESSVSWIGRIPSHWQENRAKYYFQEVDERSKAGTEEMLSVSHVTGVTPRSQKKVTMFQAESNVGHKVCRPGDLVINTMWAWMAAMGVSKHLGLVSPAYGVYRLHDTESFDSYYLDKLSRIEGYRSEYICRSTGIRSSRLRLYPDKFLSMRLICPPKEEQGKIVNFLKLKELSFRKFIRNKRKLIELLKEQKQNIINKAITRGINPDINLKPSGVQWLGDIPEHWPVMKLKRLVSMKSGDSITSLSIDECGNYPVYGGNGQRGFSSSYTHDGDFILVGRQGALCGNVHLVNGRFWASEHAIVTTLNGNDDIRWLSGLLRVMNLNQYSESAAQPGISVEKIINLQIPVPPLNEQSKIAAYFSNESKNIDVAISKTMREIDLMREYRARLISDVVTGKVDVRNIELAPVPEEELLAIEDDIESIDDAEQDDIPETEE